MFEDVSPIIMDFQPSAREPPSPALARISQGDLPGFNRDAASETPLDDMGYDAAGH
jgi:hypothetical protein